MCGVGFVSGGDLASLGFLNLTGGGYRAPAPAGPGATGHRATEVTAGGNPTGGGSGGAAAPSGAGAPGAGAFTPLTWNDTRFAFAGASNAGQQGPPVASAGAGAGGRVYRGVMHVSDWLPTLCEAAGCKPGSALPLDGVSAWSAITGVALHSFPFQLKLRRFVPRNYSRYPT